MKVVKSCELVLKIILMTLGVVGMWHNKHNIILPSLTRLLPAALWAAREPRPEQNTASNCELPMTEDLQYAANSWQLLELAKGSLYLYAAYWDTRYNPQVIVLVYCDFIPLPQLYCLLWYENDTKPSTVPASLTYAWLQEWDGLIDGVNEPYVVSCKVRRRPAAVSLVTAFCFKPTNVLAVQGSREERGSGSPAALSIGVCLKWMRYDEDISAILIEWIEILKAFGADNIYVYVIKVHPYTKRVLHHYSSLGVIDVTPFTQPLQRRSNNFSSEERKFHDLRQEVLPLNDCLYRAVSSGSHQWLANIDVDEVIVPIRDITWQKLVAQESQVVAEKYGEVDALAFLNYFFLDGAQRDRAAPIPAKILAHAWRAKDPNSPMRYVKCFHNVSSVVAAHNHYPSRCGEQVQEPHASTDACRWHVVPGTTARLHHYRARCPYDEPDCPEMHDVVRDDALARLRPIAAHVRVVLRDLGIPFNET